MDDLRKIPTHSYKLEKLWIPTGDILRIYSAQWLDHLNFCFEWGRDMQVVGYIHRYLMQLVTSHNFENSMVLHCTAQLCSKSGPSKNSLVENRAEYIKIFNLLNKTCESNRQTVWRVLLFVYFMTYQSSNTIGHLTIPSWLTTLKSTAAYIRPTEEIPAVLLHCSHFAANLNPPPSCSAAIKYSDPSQTTHWSNPQTVFCSIAKMVDALSLFSTEYYLCRPLRNTKEKINEKGVLISWNSFQHFPHQTSLIPTELSAHTQLPNPYRPVLVLAPATED